MEEGASTFKYQRSSALYSVQRQISDGNLQVVTVKIPYEDKSTIHVLVDDVQISSGTVQGSPYTWRWDSDNIRISPKVASGSQVLVRRVSPADSMKNIFNGQAEFTDESMDQNFKQLLWLAQEYGEGSGLHDVFSNINMHGYKITNVGRATEDDDVVTFGQYRDDALGASAARDKAVAAKNAAQKAKKLAQQAKTAAQTSAAESLESATNAKKSATSAASSSSSAKSSANTATTKASQAASSASTATTKASQASASASKAKTSEKNAKTSETNAKGSETKAKTSETNAKASETKAKASQDQATRQAQLAKEYANQSADGQIKADWAQTDSSEKSYIKNKPNLGDYVTKKGAVVYDNLNLATEWPDGKTKNHKFVQVIQSGTPYNSTVGIQSLGGNLLFGAGQAYNKLKQIWFTTPNALLYNKNAYSQDGVTLLKTEPPLQYDHQYTLMGSDQSLIFVAGLQGNNYKTFEFGTDGSLYAHRAVLLQDPNIVVSDSSTKPSSNRFFTFGGTDKNNDSLGMFQAAVRNTGATDAKVRVFKLGDKSQVAELAVGFDADGNSYSRAPTPPDSSNDTNIATTSFTNKKVNALKTGLTGGSVKVSKATTADTANAVAWGKVTGKPSTFNPSTHTHTASQITDLSSLIASASEIDSYQIQDSGNYLGYIRFKNRIQVAWGTAIMGYGVTTVNFLVPFADSQYAATLGYTLSRTSQGDSIFQPNIYIKNSAYIMISQSDASRITYFICIGKW